MSRPLPRYTPDTDPRKVDRCIDNTPHTPPTQAKQAGHRSGEGDKQRMRLIPVIAQGVPGTIPLTEGYAALEHKQRMTRRFKAHRLHRA